MTSQENSKAVCPESTIESATRRDFIRKTALAATAAGVGGILLGSSNEIPSSSASSAACTCRVSAYSCCYVAVSGTSVKEYGVYGHSCDLPGVFGIGPIGLKGCGTVGLEGCGVTYGVKGKGACGVFGCGSASGVHGQSSAGCGVYGRSDSGKGVVGYSCSDVGVFGCSGSSYGLYGATTGTKSAAGVAGRAGIDGIGVCGQAGCGGTGVYGQNCGQSCCSYGVQGYSPESTGVYGKSCHGTGVWGYGAFGVKGKGTYIGVCATSCNIGVYALGNNIAVRATANKPTTIPLVVCGLGCANLQEWNVGCVPKSVVNKSGWLGIGTCTPSTPLDVVGTATIDGSLISLAGAAGTVPIIAKGASGQTANLQQWENSCGTVFAVINKAGSLGLGGVTNPHHVLCISGKAHASSGFSIGPCTCINTTLVVNGSMAAKTRCVTASGCLASTDYGVFASGAITLTLPPAKTQKGMMLFIKNTSTSTITIKPGGTDTIEGKASCSPKTLGKQYDSLTLISNGISEWFIQSGVKCGTVTS